ncbi:hypothetical protein BRC65_08920 [Halobacteriales archaeon QH_2_65_14]|nr:MAG: hypothetical protein BRC65_08920 [Halobacteriales archaeon QH_2_65_14]
MWAASHSGCCDSFRPGAKLSLFGRLKRARSDSTAGHTHNNHYQRRSVRRNVRAVLDIETGGEGPGTQTAELELRTESGEWKAYAMEETE